MGSLGDVLAGPPEVSINEVASTLTLDEALAAAGSAVRRRPEHRIRSRPAGWAELSPWTRTRRPPGA
jgi:hypothetical protein